MSDDHERDADVATYTALLTPSFFEDTGATEQRLQSERKRAKTPKQRIQAKKRPLTRTEFIGFRTTAEIAGAVETLRTQLGEAGNKLSVTEVMERAVEALRMSARGRA